MLWTDRDENTYCVVDSTGNHECLTYDALVIDVTVGDGDNQVVRKRPVIHILYSYDRSGFGQNTRRILLGLNFAHETAHCFQMYEAYKEFADHDPNLSTSGAACDCIMKPLVATEADKFKTRICRGLSLPFCNRCESDLEELISNLTLPGNT